MRRRPDARAARLAEVTSRYLVSTIQDCHGNGHMEKVATTAHACVARHHAVRRTDVAHVRSALEIPKKVQCRVHDGVGTREGKPVLPLQLLAIYRVE